MTDDRPYIITVRRKSRNRRFWRELFALFSWGAQKHIYDSNAPFGVLGHENFSVSMRKQSHEIEIAYFEDLYDSYSPEYVKMHREIQEAVVSIVKRNIGVEAYIRTRQ